MKLCPKCRRDYSDDTLLFCLDDGQQLLDGPADFEEPSTAILHSGNVPDRDLTRELYRKTSDKTAILHGPAAGSARKTAGKRALVFGVLGIVVCIAIATGSYMYYGREQSKQIESIAVMPFVNESGNADVEYLSDGMTETLISSLTKLPGLNVKARSSVFRYKGKEADAKTIGSELNVQAILNGRVVQQGDDLTVSLELVDVSTENAIWSQQYSRKRAELVSLQSDVGRKAAMAVGCASPLM